MSPMEMWCNESQERYVFTISRKKLPALKHISDLERCPFSVAGHMTEERIIHVDFSKIHKPIGAGARGVKKL